MPWLLTPPLPVLCRTFVSSSYQLSPGPVKRSKLSGDASAEIKRQKSELGLTNPLCIHGKHAVNRVVRMTSMFCPD